MTVSAGEVRGCSAKADAFFQFALYREHIPVFRVGQPFAGDDNDAASAGEIGVLNEIKDSGAGFFSKAMQIQCGFRPEYHNV